MLGEQQAESVESVGADFEGRLVDPAKELPEHAVARGRLAGVDVGVDVDGFAVGKRFVVQDNGSDGIPFESFLQNTTARTCALPAVVAIAECDNKFRLPSDDIAESIGLGRRAIRAPKPENVRDDGLGVFARFEGQAVNVVDEDGQ